MSDERKYKYQHHEPLNAIEPTYDHNGNPAWESMSTPADFKVRANCQIPSHLPGLIIFVHGVNSEGEWYERAEKALCDGLNERLGREGPTEELQSIKYDPNDNGPKGRRRASYKDGITPRSSPVIRFYWGYRAPDDKEGKYKYIVPLRNLQGDDLHDAAYWSQQTPHKAPAADPRPGPWYWGGGAFQNGCNALPMLWRNWGFEKWQQFGPIPVSVQMVNTELDRQLNDAPPRNYYAHAANRLAKLIKRIRDTYPHDTVTVISHSQGTMVALAAAAMEAPDTLMLMNSPYTLDTKFTDGMASSTAVLSTAQARQKTLVNIVNKVAANANRLHAAKAQDKQLYVGASTDSDGLICGWRPEESVHRRADGSEIKERDNHGRTYVYFNPHDRVMGLSPLQSLGWQGVPDDDKTRQVWAPCAGKLYQRMLARNTPCGGAPNANTPFGTLPDMAAVADKPGNKPFWDGNEKVTIFRQEVWATPEANHTVNINAEEVPEPLQAAELADFDKNDHQSEVEGDIGPGWGQSREKDGVLTPNEPDFRYYASIYEPANIYDPTQPTKHKDGDRGGYRPETNDEMLKRIKRYVRRSTDHSSLPMHQPFMQRVVAYDLPIGHCEASSDLNFLMELRNDADWVQPGADAYWQSGTLDIPPMPTAIDPETVQEAAEKRASLQHGK